MGGTPPEETPTALVPHRSMRSADLPCFAFAKCCVMLRVAQLCSYDLVIVLMLVLVLRCDLCYAVLC